MAEAPRRSVRGPPTGGESQPRGAGPNVPNRASTKPPAARFLDPPEALREEILRRAQDLHCSHAGLPVDLSHLQAPVHPGNLIDYPDFISRKHMALPRLPEPSVAGAPWMYHALEHAVKRGSTATFLDDMPRPLVSAVTSFRLRLLVGVLEALATGTASRLLSAVLHLCLAKKLLAWLMPNSRPVMLEAYLRRLETGVVHTHRVTRRELRRAVPVEHFAHRGQLLGQTVAMTCCQLLAGCAIQHGDTWSDDWNEANALGNQDREAAGAWDHENPEELCRPSLATSTMGSTCG